MTSIAVSVSCRAASQAGLAGVVEHAAEHALSSAQCVDRVVDLSRLDPVLADDDDGSVGQDGQLFRVGYQADRRCIEDDIVGLLLQGVEDTAEGLHVFLDGLRDCLAVQNDGKLRARHFAEQGLDFLIEIDCIVSGHAVDTHAQFLEFGVLHVQYFEHGRFAEVHVDENHAFVDLGHSERDIGRDGRFTLVLHGAGHQEDFLVVLGHLIGDTGRQLAHVFCVAEAGDGIRDEDTGLLAADPALASSVLLLVHDGREELGVDLALDLGAIADGVAHVGHEAEQRANEDKNQPREQNRVLEVLERVLGLLLHLGSFQNGEFRAAHEVAGEVGVVLEDGLRLLVGDVGGRRADGDLEEVGLAESLGGRLALELFEAQFFGDLILELLAHKDVLESRRAVCAVVEVLEYVRSGVGRGVRVFVGVGDNHRGGCRVIERMKMNKQNIGQDACRNRQKKDGQPFFGNVQGNAVEVGHLRVTGRAHGLCSVAHCAAPFPSSTTT